MPRLPKGIRRRKSSGAIEAVKSITVREWRDGVCIVRRRKARKSFPTTLPTAEAIRQARNWLAGHEPAAPMDPAEGLTWSEAVKSWAEGPGSARTERSRRIARNWLDGRVADVLGAKVAVRRLVQSDLWRLRTTLSRDLAPSTVQGILSTVRAVLGHVGAWQRLKVRKIVPTVARKPAKRLWPEEVAKLEAAQLLELDRDRLVVSLDTGLRYNELRQLHLGSLIDRPVPHLDLSTIHTKGDDVDRSIPLITRSAEILERRASHTPRGRTLFPEVPEFPESVARRIRALSGQAFTWHQLRHTFACELLEMGVELRIVSYLLGHKDVRTSMIYVQASFRDAIRALLGVTDPVTDARRVVTSPRQELARMDLARFARAAGG